MTDTKKETPPGFFKRIGRLAWRGGLTLTIIATALMAVYFGSSELARRAQAAPKPQPAAVLPVAVTPIELHNNYQIARRFVGQVEPQKTVSISFELSGQLDQILVDEGDQITEGQQIAALDTQLLDADRVRLEASKSALEAQLRFAEQTVERQSQLSDRGFASQSGLDEALSRSDELRARIAEVQAALTSNTIQAEKSIVYAPFTGRITDRPVDGGESLSPGQTVVEIVQDGTPQLRIGVPLDVTATILSQAEVEIGGLIYDASLITLRPDVDPVTRTRTALLQVKTDDALAFGQTARLILTDRVEATGLWVPTTTLKEGARGQWTLLTVDVENIVRQASVQVLHTDGDQVFVRGVFPDGARLITSGPQRVTPGQRVDPRPIKTPAS